MLRRTRQFLFLILILIAGAAHAAELGEPRVASHIGQQLVADIELTLLEDANTAVQARLASPEVYNGAGIAVPPVLSSLTLTVMRRDGRQFLHATTLRPVEADHLHLYLELVDHGQRVVRLATLWLTPDPNPAPAIVPAPAEPAPPALAWAKRPASAPVHAEPPAVKIAPPPPLPPPAPAPKLLPLPVHGAAKPAACAPQGDAEACVALGAKNAELRARIGQLEQRVKGLQASLGAGQPGKPAVSLPVAPKPEAPKPAAPKPEAPKPAVQQPATQKPAGQKPSEPKLGPPTPPQATKALPRPAGPAPISSIKPLVPRKPRTPPPADDGLPWGVIAGGLAVLAALGGAAALVRARRKRTRKVDIPADPGMLPRLRERFFARNGVKAETDPAAARAAEPSLE